MSGVLVASISWNPNVSPTGSFSRETSSAGSRIWFLTDPAYQKMPRDGMG